MSDMRYPLTWPAGWPRTPDGERQRADFWTRDYRSQTRKPHTIFDAVRRVLDELRLMGADDILISSNLVLRQDGLPRSGQSTPADPGAAVYFAIGSRPFALACDKWDKPGDNLWAIAKHIEALRGQQRWGVGNLDQAFAGYAALPEPKTTWWEVLGVMRDAERQTVLDAYRRLARQHHPDTGGDQEQFIRVQMAWEQAATERGWKS